MLLCLNALIDENDRYILSKGMSNELFSNYETLYSLQLIILMSDCPAKRLFVLM